MTDIRPYVYDINPAPAKPAALADFDGDDVEYFLEHDPELQVAYLAALQAAGIQWTDEEVAEAAFRAKYGDKIDDLMAYWRQKQALLDLANPEHERAVAVQKAVLKYQRSHSIRSAVQPLTRK